MRTRVSTEALYVIIPIWKQHKYPTAIECIKKLKGIYCNKNGRALATPECG